MPRAQQQAASALVRPTGRRRKVVTASRALLGCLAAPLYRFRAFDVARRGFGRRAAARRNRGNRYVTLWTRPVRYLHGVADFHGMGGLYTLTVETHMASADRFGSCAATFEKAGAP
jgi:hypothetical protein